MSTVSGLVKVEKDAQNPGIHAIKHILHIKIKVLLHKKKLANDIYIILWKQQPNTYHNMTTIHLPYLQSERFAVN